MRGPAVRVAAGIQSKPIILVKLATNYARSTENLGLQAGKMNPEAPVLSVVFHVLQKQSRLPGGFSLASY